MTCSAHIVSQGGQVRHHVFALLGQLQEPSGAGTVAATNDEAQQGMCWPQAAHVDSGPVLTGTLLSAQLQLVC